MSNAVTIHKGDGWLMRPTLESRNIDIEEILVTYSQGRKPWYTREHMLRILQGKKKMPLELAQDIAKNYGFNWTDFFQIPENRIKTIDAMPCTTHDMRVIFKASITKFYCPSEFTNSHYAVWADQTHPQTTYFGNQVSAIHLFSKQKQEVKNENLTDSMSHPVLLQMKKPKDWYCGFLTGVSTPVMKTEPMVYLSDIYNTRCVDFQKKDISHFHHLDIVISRPKFIE